MKTILISISLIIAGAIIWFSFSSQNPPLQQVVNENTNAVSFEENVQVIDVTSKLGGYTPTRITAKAGEETVLRITSENSFGCERAFRIPQLNVDEILPVDGESRFDLGKPQKGDQIYAACSMGMYTFTILFE